MNKLFLLCLLLIVSIHNLQASTTSSDNEREGTITGKVIDLGLNTPLPYVNVVVKNEAGEIVTGGITDEQGEFKIGNIPDGKHSVSIQYIGFKTVTKEINIGSGNYKIDLGNIGLEEEAAGLDEVIVVAEVSSIQQKVDRKVITIGKDLAAVGTASDIMVGLPSVSVDAQTGEISLRGNSNVRVMVDGKISNIPTAQLLKQLPSTAIKSIELITNPSAKYNPEGMSGIINIVLHKNTMVGFNGSMNVGLSYEKEAKFNSALNMNYRNGKFNFYGNYSDNISKNDNYGFVYRPDDNSEQFFKFLDNRKSHLFKVGLDFYLNEKNTLSFFTDQNITNSSTEGQTDALFYDNPTYDQSQIFVAESDNSTSQYNFDYKLDFDKEGHNIELEVDYSVFDETRPVDYNFLLGTQEDYNEINYVDRESTTVNLDYVNPLSEAAKLELGLEARLFNSVMDYSSTGQSYNESGILIPTPDTNFDYTRDIYSAYANYNKKFEKWTYQIGVRIENVFEDALALQTEIETDIITPILFKNDYFEIYPSVFFTYSPTEKNSYQLSYSRRVDRPGIGQVNPIKEWSTPLVSSYGNINLLPQFTNSIEVNYTRNLKDQKGSVTAGVFFRAISDEINRALFIDRTDINSGRIILTHDNFDDTSAYGLEVSSNYRPFKWWNINSSFDLYSQTQKGITERLTAPIEIATEDDIVTEVVEVENVAWNFRMYNNFTLNKTFSLTAFGFYRGENKTIQFDIDPMYFVNLGLRVNFLEDRGTFSFNYNDIFNTMKFQGSGTTPYTQDLEFNWESNTWSVGFSYRFGGGKYRAKSRKSRDDDTKEGSGGFI